MNDQNGEAHEGLDETDRALVTALQEDGRLGYAELGEMVGLTAGGARRRVMRLEERGIVQIVGVTNPLHLGYRSMAMVGIVADGDIDRLAEALGEIEEVIYVVLTAGRYDVLAEVIAADNEELFEIVGRRLRALPGVARAEAFTYYSIRTHRFGWGTR